MNPAIGIVSFIGGAILGAAISYIYTKNTCEKRSQATINEMREYYKKKYGVKEDKEEEKKVEEPTFSTAPDIYEKPDTTKTKYTKITKDYAASTEYKDKDQEEKKPYIITEEEYENDGITCITLGWYRDCKQLIVRSGDEYGARVGDPDKLVGEDNLKKLEESEDGYIYVRNDSEGKDFTIVSYSGVPKLDTYDEDTEDEVI